MTRFLVFLLLLSAASMARAQDGLTGLEDPTLDDDISIDGDIFNDFNEDLEASQVLEDERFYRYGRFFQACVGIGLTTFTGNRGAAYDDNHPSFHFSTAFFLGFNTALTLGVEFSKHTAFVDTDTLAYPDQRPGAVETSMLRPFVGFRYYIDTTDLGTALTYSNPHFITRVEYWYQTTKFPEANPDIDTQRGGGIGLGIGGGLEFPLELKKSYLSIELLYHRVNFSDRFTQDYRADNPSNAPSFPGPGSINDLRGDVWSMMMTYNFTW